MVRDGYNTEDALSVTGFEDIPACENVSGGLSAKNVRKMMTDFFSTTVG